jgi:hypothetical protein
MLQSTRGENRSTNSLIRVAIQNVAPSVLAFGIGGEQFFIPLDGDAPIAIDVAAPES